MPADKQKTPLSALLAAAMALPIVAVPLQLAAEEAAVAKPLLPPGAAVGLRNLWYREDGTRMKVTEPVLWFKTPIADVWELAASATVDIVSGASPIIVSNADATRAPQQIYTGASITDRRRAGDVSVTRKVGAQNENSVGLTWATSNEEDYQSRAWGVNAGFDFNERNTTLALGLGGRRDRVMSTTEATLNESRRAREFLIGVTQLLDRRTLVQSNLTVTTLTGYLDDPYKSTFTFYRDGRTPAAVLARDRRPDSRRQIAWLTRGKHALAGSASVLSAEYRYYRDDWGIRSHTLAASWLAPVTAIFQVEGGLRYYTQTAADFYRAEIRERPAPRITSSDQRLAAFGVIEPSIKVIAKLDDHISIDLAFSRYMQRAQWRLSGNAGNAFVPLNAKLVNVGVTYRF
jgi:Protein of unknown function (DUF3570)